ncbi:hypothetical protein [Paracidovorax oryzae]|uniref:hypothetical protein n=1 Tax=Paracidovorax oryzae TaxID=862720 RepID=UPI0012FF3CAA|nr:hypothetical protein [Paracidovorax oryzae]
MNSPEAQFVAVIFEMDAREQIMKLAGSMPVWAIESTTNAKAIDDARQQYHSPLAIFFARPGESRMDMCSRVLFDVDEHHQCDTFDLYGASEGDIGACQGSCRVDAPAQPVAWYEEAALPAGMD